MSNTPSGHISWVTLITDSSVDNFSNGHPQQDNTPNGHSSWVILLSDSLVDYFSYGHISQVILLLDTLTRIVLIDL